MSCLLIAFIAMIVVFIIIPEFIFPPLIYVGMILLLLAALALLFSPWLVRQRFGGMTLSEWWENSQAKRKRDEKPKREYRVGDDGELLEIIEEEPPRRSGGVV